MSENIVIVCAIVYSIISTTVEVLLKRNSAFAKLSKEIEKFSKRKDKIEKLVEVYYKLFKATLKYTIINLFSGFFFFFFLHFLLGNKEFVLPLLRVRVRWVFVYFFLVLFFTFVFKYFIKIILRVWEKIR